MASARPVVEQTKVAKDIAQATEILDFLLEMRPSDVERAYGSLSRVGLQKRALASAERYLQQDSAIRQFLARS